MRKVPGRHDPAQELFNEANRHVRAGRVARARQLARQGTQTFPSLAAFWGLAGALALLERDWEAAEGQLSRARLMNPQDPSLAANLAAAKAGRNDFAGAVPLLREAFTRVPSEPKFRAALADSLARAGQADEALALYAHPFSGDPIDLIGRHDLAWALYESRRGDAAEQLLDAIPESARNDETWRMLAIFAGDRWDIAETLARLRRPTNGQPPSAKRESAALFAAHYDDAETDESLFLRHRDWGKRVARAVHATPRAPAKARRERLRIGLVSPDFRDHSVGRFLSPLLADGRMEFFCYSDVASPDAYTARFKAQAAAWRDLFGRDDTDAARAIAADSLDVVIELAGHSYANRLTLLAQRPGGAFQATWLGYPDTTGLPTMDWRLVDAITDPTGRADGLATEKLLRVETCFICFEPPDARPSVAPEGPPVFGSFNNLEKLGPSTIALWARLLAAAPDSRLLLKSKHLARAEVREKLEAAFAAHGIGPKRLDLRARVDTVDAHLDAYRLLDVALDPLLYNGTTTTCEALSMGVPVVTLPGTRHAARVGASLLTASGFTEGLASSPEDYVARAVKLAKDRTRDRAAMRAKFEKSALCDAPGFALRFEAALRSAFT